MIIFVESLSLHFRVTGHDLYDGTSIASNNSQITTIAVHDHIWWHRLLQKNSDDVVGEESSSLSYTNGQLRGLDVTLIRAVPSVNR